MQDEWQDWSRAEMAFRVRGCCARKGAWGRDGIQGEGLLCQEKCLGQGSRSSARARQQK